MRRRALIVLLALGTIGGYAVGFAGLRHRSCAHKEAFEQRVADVCVGAAKRAATQPPTP